MGVRDRTAIAGPPSSLKGTRYGTGGHVVQQAKEELTVTENGVVARAPDIWVIRNSFG